MTTAQRPVVAFVTTHWNEEAADESAVLRLLAGAMAGVARVEIVHLDRHASALTTLRDSVFILHRLPLRGAMPLAAGVARAALARAGGGAAPAAVELLSSLDGRADDLGRVLEAIAADAVVLAGTPLPLGPEHLDVVGARRLVYCPMLPDVSMATDPSVRRVVERADAIGTLHPGEQAELVASYPDRSALVTPLDVALTLNRSTTAQGLFGVAWFGNYVVAIRRFPPPGARFERSVTHELLRSVLGPIAVAEVDGTRWRVHDVENTAELPVNPTRVNLWRLLAHAEFCVDLRPPTPFGREALESMLLGKPVIVPDNSAAKSHVEAANGGLWYRDVGELLDLANVLFEDASLRDALGASGLRYSTRHHGQMADFVERSRRLVLG